MKISKLLCNKKLSGNSLMVINPLAEGNGHLLEDDFF